jgi:TonB family protein
VTSHVRRRRTLKITNLKICFILLVLGLIWSTSALAQTQTDQERAAEQALRALRSRDIPEASLSCTADEAKWWNELRAASKALRPARAAKKERGELIRLIKQGLEKSFQVPIPDRYATVLWRSPPDYTEEARNKQISGSVALAVELLPDGTVGEVKVVQGLDPGLDQMAVSAARKMVFLPAVKDRKFTSFWMPMTMGFNIY